MIQAVNKNEVCEAWFGIAIDDAKNFLKYKLLWTINFTYREGNGAANALTKLGLNHCNKRVWMKDFSPEISHIVLNEFTQ